jgi:hypothetical protein
MNQDSRAHQMKVFWRAKTGHGIKGKGGAATTLPLKGRDAALCTFDNVSKLALGFFGFGAWLLTKIETAGREGRPQAIGLYVWLGVIVTMAFATILKTFMASRARQLGIPKRKSQWYGFDGDDPLLHVLTWLFLLALIAWFGSLLIYAILGFVPQVGSPHKPEGVHSMLSARPLKV